MSDIEFVSAAQAAEIIGVTVDTLYNWQKQNLVKIVKTVNGDQILIDDLETIRKQLADGTLDKLNKRANRKFSSASAIPVALAGTPEVVQAVSVLLKIGEMHGLPAEALLLGTAYNLLSASGLVRFRWENDQLISCLVKNRSLNTIIKEWPAEYPAEIFKKALPEILAVEIPVCRDFLGILYQSLQIAGHKSRLGIYYTPGWLTGEMAASAVKQGDKVLDPCCGSGHFLLASGEFTEPENLFGCDIDLLAVLIAKINLILMFPQKEFKPNIFCMNALTGQRLLSADFDVVIGNPPWGVHFTAEEKIQLDKLYPQIESGESFSYFIEFGLSCLKADGILNFLLPESFLNTARHKDIRFKLLNEHSIRTIHDLGAVFDGVTSQVINLEAVKEHQPAALISLINAAKNSFQVPVSEIMQFSDCIISIKQDAFDRQLIRKVYQKEHTTLKNQAEWALGIVTGNNQLFLSAEKQDGYEPVIAGRNVRPYLIEDADYYLQFEPKQLQQTAPEKFYRAEEKLIYRFISDRPVLAYDNRQRLTLNSANILIPCLENYSLLIIMALFNSRLFGYIYKKQFFSKKILRSHLESLPLPLLTDNEKNELLFYVNNYLITEDSDFLNEIDEFVYKLFDLTNEEKDKITAK